jgi:hypothetical protein
MNYGNSLTVRPVRNGRGMVALRVFETGDLICHIRGRIVTPRVVWGYWETDPRRGANCYRYDSELYLDPEGEIGAFANHSCNPNSRLVRTGSGLQLRALKKITIGREVTHDYSTQLGADDVWTMKCNCGERNCRGKVSNINKLPAKVLNRYQRLDAIPAFILETMPD